MKKKILPMRTRIIRDLVACKAAFDSVGIPWVITDGIVLGYVREKNVLAQDTDLDLGVFREISLQEWQKLFKALYGAGFCIKNVKQDFVYGKRESKLNSWFYHKRGEFYEAFPRTTPGIKFVEKAEWYDEIQSVNFLGAVYPMPNNLEDYIVCRYGKDWMEPKYTHDQWRLEKFGTSSSRFKPGVWLSSRCGPKGDLWPKIMRAEDML